MSVKVTFDTNVWQKVVQPADYLSDENYCDFCCINQAIKDGHIQPFIVQTIFDLEALMKKSRLGYLSNYKPSVKCDEKVEGGKIVLTFSIGPDENNPIEGNAFVDKYLQMAQRLGFRVLSAPRIGMPRNNKAFEFIKAHSIGDLPNMEEVSKVSSDIDSLGAGMGFLNEFLSHYSSESNIQRRIQAVPPTAAKSFAKAIAEMCDGESVAAHIAAGNDYYCTSDAARGAGTKSVFAASNVHYLQTKWGFRKVSTAELCKILCEYKDCREDFA